MIDSIKNFLRWEAAGGVLLVIAAIMALIVANSPLQTYYDSWLGAKLVVKYADFGIAKPLLLWINDGLMVLFFLLVGLELKRELLEGELASKENILFPAGAAVGGMFVPAGIYAFFNWGEISIDGWAIPAATDIAFALGVLSLLGQRVPVALKVFLVSLAIIDDIGAIIIIAIFYTDNLSFASMAIAAISLCILFVLNRRKVVSLVPYVAVGLVLWVAVLKSGVHATLAGVALAFFIPMRDPQNPDHSPVRALEHDLHPTVAFWILPLFAFANAGVTLNAMPGNPLENPVVLGVALGLLIGKPIGVLGGVWVVTRVLGAAMPKGLSWSWIFGVSFLCGIGFTMSLFIGSLAFGEVDQQLVIGSRIGILGGSILSAILGFLILYKMLPKQMSQAVPVGGDARH